MESERGGETGSSGTERQEFWAVSNDLGERVSCGRLRPGSPKMETLEKIIYYYTRNCFI